MTTVLQGVRKWGPLNVDEEGYREYKVGHLIRGGPMDGPYSVLRTPGIPSVGSTWNFGADNDPWVWCLPRRAISRLGSGDDTAVAGEDEIVWWEVESTFTNKPVESDRRRCNDNEIENPLLEPYKHSGGGNS